MKRLALLLLGVAALTSAVGCHCLYPLCGYGGSGWGACGYGYPPGACGTVPPAGTLGAPGALPGAPVTVPPQGAFYNTYDTMQTGIPGPAYYTAAQPIQFTGHSATALAPMESLPTY